MTKQGFRSTLNITFNKEMMNLWMHDVQIAKKKLSMVKNTLASIMEFIPMKETKTGLL